MALIVAEGFDIYKASPPLSSAWSVVAISPNDGRRSTPCLEHSGWPTGGTASIYYLPVEKTNGIVGFAVSAPIGTIAASTQFLNIVSSTGGVQFVVDVTIAGRIRILTAAGGSVLAESSDGAWPAGATYQYLEIKFSCTGDDTVQVRINGSDVIASTSGLNLRQSGAGGFGRLYFKAATTNGATTFFDDVYVLDSSGDAPFNDFLGDLKVDGHLFTADGLTDWTSNKANHFDAIDDIAFTYATYYNESDTVGEQDSYEITPHDMATIRAVTIRAYCRNPGGGTGKMKPFTKIGGTLYYGTEITLPADTSDLREYTWYTNPSAAPGTAWTKAALTSAEFGWETTEIS